MTTPIGAGFDQAYSVAVQDDGKLLVAGSSFNGTDFDYAIVRYNTNGTLDTSFSGDGKLTTDFGGNHIGESVTLQSDGKILVTGRSWNGGSYDFAVARYNNDGTLDTSFGGGAGIVTTAVAAGTDQGQSVTVQADGKIVVAGYSYNGSDNDFALVRYNTDGTLDTTFDPGVTNTLDGNPTFVENGAAVVLDADVDISDADLDALNGGLGNYDGANLTLVRNGGASADDVFDFNDGNGITLSGGNLIKNAQIIASFDTTSTPGELVVRFTDAGGEIPVSADVDNILRQIIYANSSGTPPSTAQIDWTFDDGNTGEQGAGGALTATGSTTVNITAVNEAPVNTVPGSQSINEDTTLTFSAANGNQISISDDSGETPTVIISVTNGTLATSGAGSATITNDGSAMVTLSGSVTDINAALDGLQYTPTSNWNGSDTFTITTTDGEVYALNIDADLLGYYEFANADPVNDSSPAGSNDGTLANDATVINDATRGEVLSLDGSGDALQIAGMFGNPTSVTLAAWVNLTSADTLGAELISLGDNVAIRLDNTGPSATLGGVTGYIYEGSGWTGLESGQFLAGTGWHHVAYTFDDANNTHTLYIDGTAVTTSAVTDNIDYTRGGNTAIGAHARGGTDWDLSGLIDDARIYSRALTEAEIASLADAPALPSDTDTVDITVTPVNDAPTLSTAAPFTDISEDDFTNNGMLVSTYAALANDVDAGHLEGIAITSVDDTNGSWQYTLDGSNWLDIGSVSTSNALLLAADATSSFRFVPNPNYNGSSGIVSYKAWDQTSGSAGTYADATASGGTTAFSSGTNGAALTVAPVNDAPELSGAGMYLTTITEDTVTNDGDLVSTIIASGGGNPITDVDAGAVEGIAIFSLSNSNGTWEYDIGSGWNPVGTVSVGSSLLLRDSDRLRFVPNANWNGTELFTFAAWDQTSGTAGDKVDTSAFGGTTAFSSGTAIPSITVTGVNDDPTVTDLIGDVLTYMEGDGVVVIEQGADALVS